MFFHCLAFAFSIEGCFFMKAVLEEAFTTYLGYDMVGIDKDNT